MTAQEMCESIMQPILKAAGLRLLQCLEEVAMADKVQEEHYQAAMGMSEKHRKNWVEACQERDKLKSELAAAKGEIEFLKAQDGAQ